MLSNDRRANATLFGFDFQVNAAIVLMLDNIKKLQSLRLESNNEDIDIELDNGNHILAQAKAIVNSSTDFRNVRKNLKKALQTLSESSNKVKTEQLILITNSPNPLNENASRSIFYGAARRNFNTLPPSSQKIITDYLATFSEPMDTNQFFIRVLPFETDDDTERHKVVMQIINDFIGDINIDIPGIGKRLHTIWSKDIFKNGTKTDEDIKLTKNSLIWPMIVIATDINRIDRDFEDRFDTVQYDEIVRRYQELINSCCERVSFFTKILYDFNSYNYSGKGKEKTLNFVNEYWQNYVSEFEVNGIDEEIAEALSKVVIYNVIRRRYDIDKIKKGVLL